MFVRQFQGICWFRGLQKSRFAVSILVTVFCWGGGFSCQTQVRTFMSVEMGAGKAVISAAGSRTGARNMYPFMDGAAQTFGIRSASGFERVRPEPAPRSTGASVLTVNQLFESFLSHADVKPSTYARYKTVIDLHILPKLGKRRVAGLTAKELSGYLAEKRKCGNLRTGGPLSEKSVRDLAVLLKSALRFAQKEFHIYTDALNMPLPSMQTKACARLFDQEVQLMAMKIQDVSNQKNTGILLALCAGMRIGEICALKVSDIDFLAGTIDISRAVQRVQAGKKTELLVQTPKSDASERVIPLTSDLLCYLKTAVRGLPEHAYILTGRTDKPMEPRTLRYYFSGFLKRCNIRYRNFHVLRHTFATRCIETGMDIKSLSELLGHADVRTTLKLYVHPSLESKRRAIQKIALLDICS